MLVGVLAFASGEAVARLHAGSPPRVIATLLLVTILPGVGLRELLLPATAGYGFVLVPALAIAATILDAAVLNLAGIPLSNAAWSWSLAAIAVVAETRALARATAKDMSRNLTGEPGFHGRSRSPPPARRSYCLPEPHLSPPAASNANSATTGSRSCGPCRTFRPTGSWSGSTTIKAPSGATCSRCFVGRPSSSGLSSLCHQVPSGRRRFPGRRGGPGAVHHLRAGVTSRVQVGLGSVCRGVYAGGAGARGGKAIVLVCGGRDKVIQPWRTEPGGTSPRRAAALRPRPAIGPSAAAGAVGESAGL